MLVVFNLDTMDDLIKILPELAKSMPDAPELREAVLFALWRKAAGKGLRDHTIPVSVEGKTMHVAVRDPIWKRNLEKLAPQLLDRINRLMGSKGVAYIAFEMDESLFQAQAAAERTVASATDSIREVPAVVKQRSEAIRDPELRRQFLDAARAYLGTRQSKEEEGSKV